MTANPRYVTYCIAQGEPDPERMLARDRERYPGGRMTGFILWASQKWREWDRLNGRAANSPHSAEDHAAFDAWLPVAA